MNQEICDLNNKIYADNNNLLLGIVNDLQQVINNSSENLTIKRIGDVINKMNFIINENKKNMELIINQFNIINKKLDGITINNKEIKYEDRRYVGQVVNGLPEGKGIAYYNDGERYEGDWRNGKREGKGIYYYSDGDRRMGDYHNDKPIGKHVMLTKIGDIKIQNY